MPNHQLQSTCHSLPLRGNKRLHRFTLRGRTKVDGQWRRYCLVHNIEKLAHHGYAQ